MSLKWAVGVSSSDPQTLKKFLKPTGGKAGSILKPRSRTEFPSRKGPAVKFFKEKSSSSKRRPAEQYLDGFRFALPNSTENRHEAFTLKTGAGVTIHVPTLVLIRAFFKPHHFLLPAVFSHAAVYRLSFFNYSATPPTVVIDDVACGKYLGDGVRNVPP